MLQILRLDPSVLIRVQAIFVQTVKQSFHLPEHF